MHLRALFHPERDAFRTARLPGSINVSDIAPGCEGSFWFFCPCGCDRLKCISVGVDCKPRTTPSWRFNGNSTAPTLQPSVRQLVCGWHGWLRDGYWEAC